MAHFRTQYNKEHIISLNEQTGEVVVKDFTSDHGTKTAPKYEFVITKDGDRILEQVGEIPTYDMIQESKGAVDLMAMLTRYTNGDRLALQNVNLEYGDMTGITNLNEASQLLMKIENEFSKLSAEDRAKFDYSVHKFISNYEELVQEAKEVAVEQEQEQEQEEQGGQE